MDPAGIAKCDAPNQASVLGAAEPRAGKTVVFQLGQVDDAVSVQDAARLGVDSLVGAQDGEGTAGACPHEPEAVDGDSAVGYGGGRVADGHKLAVLGRGGEKGVGVSIESWEHIVLGTAKALLSG